MTGAELRQKFLQFFEGKGHTIIPSASLIPENDPSVLFTTAGMHPLVPYLLGEPHPGGTRLTNVQKCVRTGDIEEVGDNRHLTFFEMLGNWSLGDYFKEDAINWSWEFLTDKKWLGIDPQKIYVSVFEGDEMVARDDDSIIIWQENYRKLGIEAAIGERIYTYGREKNWWGPAGETGPCGPDTEIFFDTGKEHDGFYGDKCHPNCDCGRFIEIWNNVFMQFDKNKAGEFKALLKPSVDTGMGLERTVAVLNNYETVFEIDEFQAIFLKIRENKYKVDLASFGIKDQDYKVLAEEQISRLTKLFVDKSERIIADHIRTAVFILGDAFSVSPSNVGQGYVLRRLIRRSIRYLHLLGVGSVITSKLADVVIAAYKEQYPELEKNRKKIQSELSEEEKKFVKTLDVGISELKKLIYYKIKNQPGYISGNSEVRDDEGRFYMISAAEAFKFYQSFGLPKELIEEELLRIGYQEMTIPRYFFPTEAFDDLYREHQEKSRQSNEKKFAGGLADHSEETVRLHTATHLLHRALKNVLGDHVEQKGSNITPERLRFDFTHPEKVTAEQLKEVESQVNKAISDDLPMRWVEMTTEEAKASGAIGYFEDKYAQLGGKIKVYMAGDETKGYFSKEICGGPHVTHTGELGSFKILKEEAVSAGIRRIKASVSGPFSPQSGS